MKASPETIAQAAELLKRGEVVAFPTETVYGLGANALSDPAVRRIFAAKNRPADNPLIVHIYNPAQMDELCYVNDMARALIKAFCPGPLTMLLPKKPIVPDVCTAGLSSVGIRIPSHPVAREMLRVCGLPIAAPSANRSTRPSPTQAAHVLEDMDGLIPMILDGGSSDVGVESTVVDLTGSEPIVLRPGAVTPEMIRAAVGFSSVADSVMRPLREGEAAPSPGMRHKHYAPRGRMTIICGEAIAVENRIRALYDASENACILALTPHIASYGDRRVMDLGEDENAMAHNIFSILREADEQGIDRLFAEGIASSGMGLAVMNRMARAAAFDIENV